MSKSLVRARPFAKKKKPLSLKRMAHKAAKKTGIPLPSFSLNLSKTTKSVLSWSAIAAILLFFTFTFLIKGILFQEKFQITSVRFSQQTLETYEDIDLFNTVYRAVKDKNFYMLIRFDKEEVLAAIQEDFPQIQDIRFQLERNQETHAEEETEESTTGLADLILGESREKNLTNQLPINLTNTGKIQERNVQSTGGGILGVDLTFVEPLLVVKLGEKKFGVRGDSLFRELEPNHALGMDTFLIDTPQYLSGITTLSGFFFEIPVSTFLKAIPLIQEKFPTMERFVYLAGSSRIAVFTNQEQVFYLNIASSELLQKQFQKYDTLKQRYPNFDQLLSVDLGALDETKVIVRKK